jgi:RNA polymerase sigma factor (sigma-70 family)
MRESDHTGQQTESLQPLVGDKTAFEVFYRSTITPLTAFLVFHGAHVNDAGEVAHDTLRKAYERWRKIDNPRAWAFRVAARELVRRVASVKRHPIVDPAELSPVMRSDPIGDWQIEHDLITALKALPPRQRQVMAWTFFGYTPSEIAAELRLTSEQVRSNLRLARRRLAGHANDGQVTT